MYNDVHVSDLYETSDGEYIGNTLLLALETFWVFNSVAQHMHNGLAELMLDNEENCDKELMTEDAFDNLYKDWTNMLTKVHNDQRISKHIMLELEKGMRVLVDNIYTVVLNDCGEEGRGKLRIELYASSGVYAPNKKRKGP